ncbi:MAG: hypothetical protein R2717_01115 [Schumannella sp.]
MTPTRVGVVYQVPVVERRREVPAGAGGAPDRPGRRSCDARRPHDPAFGPAVLEAISSGAAPRGSGGDVLTGEQSNTSIVVDTDAGELLVKVFRTVRHGRNPDAELQWSAQHGR